MESIVQIRQMMAEQKFFEVQKIIELQLPLHKEARSELLLLYFEVLKFQDKHLPDELLVELAEFQTQQNNHDFVNELLKAYVSEKFFLRVHHLKIKSAEAKGKMELLYSLLSELLLRQFEKQVPLIPLWAQGPIDKYFSGDFGLKLKVLAVHLLLEDISRVEAIVKDLIISTVEKSSPKAIRDKFKCIAEVLQSKANKTSLEIYQNFCLISARGIEDTSDYKRLVEMVIFFDDFRFQVLVLNLLHQLELFDVAQDYTLTVKKNKHYTYVYFDKFFPHLKTYFLKLPLRESQNTLVESSPTPDLTLEDKAHTSDIFVCEMSTEELEGEKNYMHLLKYQNYSAEQLCEIAVSFLQSEMPQVALMASDLALASSKDEKTTLKALYLRLTSQLQLKDYRAAVDTCFNALSIARTRDDILSFLYGQAEAYVRLNDKGAAKSILSKIISIDSTYRMARERLAKL